MNAIGGYFGLELNENIEFHQNAIRLNTGRNALEYILRVKKYKKIFVPYFTCDVLLEPIRKLGIELQFYNINTRFEPIFNVECVENDQAFLYTNYFGLKDEFISKFVLKCKNVIIDNAQSFFSKPIQGIDTFYSPRKFLGVSDGGYLYTDTKLEEKLNMDFSYNRFAHLLKRIDLSAEDGYLDFNNNDTNLVDNPILEMSILTQSLLATINYDKIIKKRLENFNFLHNELKFLNKLTINKLETQVPMVYPLWTNDKELKSKLFKNKVYCATYWPNVLKWVETDTVEYKLSSEVIYLPIDQRYDQGDVMKLINLITKC